MKRSRAGLDQYILYLSALFFIIMINGMQFSTQAAPILVSHQAEYKLTASQIRDGNITNALGNMSFELRDGCTGWATHQKMNLLTATRTGEITTTISNSAYWENKDGRLFSFVNLLQQGALPPKVTGGKAFMTTKGGYVVFDTPAPLFIKLPPNTLFPTSHTLALLGQSAHTASGKPISLTLFDGTTPEAGVKTYITFLKAHKSTFATPASLKNIPIREADITYYPANPEALLPEYKTHTQYLENGIARELDLEFPTFTVHASLQKLILLKSSSCS